MSEPIMLEERVSRRVVKALMSQFSSVASAVAELVDNPIDYANGEQIEIDLFFDKKRRRIIIESKGGRGMGPEEIQGWLSWGSDVGHKNEDIGFYGQGGKAACGFLAKDVRLFAKKAGSKIIYMIEDIGWADRTETRRLELNEIPVKDAPELFLKCPPKSGCVRIEMNEANMDRRWNVEVLCRQLSSTYAALIHGKGLIIRVNNEVIKDMHLPLDTKVETVNIDLTYGNVTVCGWAAKLDRSKLGDLPVKSGFRLTAKGRLITDGEWFGYNYQGKGSLNYLIGELSFSGLTPNLNKSDFTERNDKIWEQIGADVLKLVAPLLAKLRSASTEVSVNKSEVQRAKLVTAELTQVVSKLIEEGRTDMISVSMGRKRPTPAAIKQQHREHKATGRTNKPRTPAPPDPVGGLQRVIRQLSVGHFPPIEIAVWSGEQRSIMDRGIIKINKSYPMYAQMGGVKTYIAESALIELVKCDPDVKDPIAAFDRVNDLMVVYSNMEPELVRNGAKLL